MDKNNEISLARQIKAKTKYDLKAYCELRGLSMTSLYKGYLTKRAKKILEKDGIKVA
jgi:hypothetical protein cfetvA_11529